MRSTVASSRVTMALPGVGGVGVVDEAVSFVLDELVGEGGVAVAAG